MNDDDGFDDDFFDESPKNQKVKKPSLGAFGSNYETSNAKQKPLNSDFTSKPPQASGFGANQEEDDGIPTLNSKKNQRWIPAPAQPPVKKEEPKKEEVKKEEAKKDDDYSDGFDDYEEDFDQPEP